MFDILALNHRKKSNLPELDLVYLPLISSCFRGDVRISEKALLFSIVDSGLELDLLFRRIE